MLPKTMHRGKMNENRDADHPRHTSHSRAVIITFVKETNPRDPRGAATMLMRLDSEGLGDGHPNADAQPLSSFRER